MASIEDILTSSGTSETGCTAEAFAIYLAASLIIGFLISFMYSYRNPKAHGFAAIAIIPAIVTVIILVVNSNIGAGIAVLGAFSLVRFRSAPGTAQEIATIFLAMGAGLMVGMGFIAYAFVFALVVGAFNILYSSKAFDWLKGSDGDGHKVLKITVPEDLNYTGAFDDIFREMLSSCTLTSSKTANMGTMYRLSYDVVLKDPAKEKEMIDRIRCRNGNLEVSLMLPAKEGQTL